jgi:hypothetical protein
MVVVVLQTIPLQKESQYAYGADLDQSRYAYGGLEDPHMHTGIAWH